MTQDMYPNTLGSDFPKCEVARNSLAGIYNLAHASIPNCNFIFLHMN